jgi:hypothetical protein
MNAQEKLNKKYATIAKNAKHYKDVVSGRKESIEVINLRKRKAAR